MLFSISSVPLNYLLRNINDSEFKNEINKLQGVDFKINSFNKDYSIDDTKNYGVDKFGDRHIHFGSNAFFKWNNVLDFLIN